MSVLDVRQYFQEAGQLKPVPGPVEVEFFWKRMEEEAEVITKKLTAIRWRLDQMRRWAVKGYVGWSDLEQAGECHRLMMDNFLRTMEELVAEQFSDGGGI